MASILSMKEEEEEEEEEDDCNCSLEDSYKRLCLDLNMDVETGMDGWNCYLNLCKHYYFEGDQLHWLAVSLYVSCRKKNYSLKSTNNPISISRLLKSANNLNLLVFFDKLHKWIDMENLPDSMRKSLDQIEYSFNISSIIFQKYFQIFLQIFGGNEEKLNEFNYQEQRKSMKINPKLNHLYKQRKLSHCHLYQFIWTNFSLSKSVYPTTSNDLIASFHLLLASFLFVYLFIKKGKLDHLIKGNCLNECGDDINLIGIKLSSICGCSSEMLNVICEEYFHNGLFKRIDLNDNERLNENELMEMINQVNNEYDEIVLRNCIIDERIFLENKNQFNDLLNPLNENRNQKSLENRTPLTANQHLTFLSKQSNESLTPISQANQLIQFLNLIVKDQESKATNNLIQLISQQLILDDLVQRLNEWEKIFVDQYNSNEKLICSNLNFNEENRCGSSKYRFDLSLKLFYLTLEKILFIEKKRLLSNHSNNEQIEKSFQKLLFNNEFLKSLLGLCLLMVFYAHSDTIHDFHWILEIYSLHGYSFLKIIQIFLKSSKEINQSRIFIKYFSSIEEMILSSMVFSNDSPLWIEMKSKGFLTFEFISRIHSKESLSRSPSNDHLTQLFNQSPNSKHVKRKLFQTNNSHCSTNELSIIRSRSDPLVEKSMNNLRKLSPYTMFYRKLYELVLSRLHLISLRLFGNQSNEYEKMIWNIFLYLFENFTEFLFRSRDLDQILLSIIYYSVNSNICQKKEEEKEQLTWFRLIQAYKSMPNCKLKTVRSVFIRRINDQEILSNEIKSDVHPCLTPSKPAGTIHIIDGNLIGDIASFYTQIFSQIENLDQNLKKYFKENLFLDLPIKNKFQFNSNEQLSINCGENFFVHYSTNQFEKNLFTNSNETNQISKNNSQSLHSNNILSSSIQAGLNNRVQTTRTRTEDGKFLTTISTISKINQSNGNELIHSSEQNQFTFGQSTTNQSFKRQHSLNSLTSLTKKVLQMENDRLSQNT